MVDSLVGKDAQTVWQRAMRPERIHKAFQFQQELAQQSSATRQQALGSGASVMPASINDKLLTKTLRNGDPLCASYQVGQCKATQCTENHLCAIVLKSGRACGGKHMAKDCFNRKFLAVADAPVMAAPVPSGVGPTPEATAEAPAEEVQFVPPSESESEAESPQMVSKGEGTKASGRKRSAPVAAPAASSKKSKGSAKPPEPKGPPPKARPPAPVVTYDLPEPPATFTASAADQKWDRLATIKGKRAQAPTLVLRTRTGGQLWLAGIPTEASKKYFPQVQLQVACFQESPQSRGGVILPGAVLRNFYLADGRRRSDEWKLVWPLIRQSLWCGESVLLHCISGRHRAAGTSTLVRALLLGETWEESARWHEQNRDVDLRGLMKEQKLAQWLHETVNSTGKGVQWPAPTGYLATAKSALHLQGFDRVPLCSHKQTMSQAQRLQNPMFSVDVFTAIAWGRPWCQSCLTRAPASWQPE
eukprot:Skav204466  [mRNA]  locus=scaffold5533:30858:32279:- [translate_table: standard]